MNTHHTTRIALVLIVLFSAVVLWATFVIGDGNIDFQSDSSQPAIQQTGELSQSSSE